MGKLYPVWILAGCVLAVGTASSSVQAAPGDIPETGYIKIPCGAGNTDKTVNGLSPCSVVQPRVIDNLYKRVDQQVNGGLDDNGKMRPGFYGGCDWDSSMPDNGVCQGRKIPGRTCDAFNNGVPMTFNHMIESDSNHQGGDCGLFTTFAAYISGKTCAITTIQTGDYGTREGAYSQGAWVEALNCYHAQVKNELLAGGLKLTSVNGQQGPCAALAVAVRGKQTEVESFAKNLELTHSNQDNVGDIENCNAAVARGDQHDSASLMRNSACHLEATRAALEAMFNQLAVCETFYRAQNSYLSYLGTQPNRDSVVDDVIASLQGMQSDRSKCNGGIIQAWWYIPRYLNRLQTTAARYWNASICK